MDDKDGSLMVDLKKEGRSLSVEKRDGWTLIEVLKDIGSPVDGVIVLSDDRPIPVDTYIKDLVSIVVINVASGG
jgi:sulfur carrier protein ThiS